ncbi:E3 ubiquitin ligase PARAQUAT TOLERANCE 3-like [Solanum pennellii]|uniref:E3 ubiquitin ligase PARAQUAT TOLERANCE 3-like n=1 Tax=Solanum pennellii TaxID=28526 RepID=A0ABM1GBB6_SOLPN|nr:E3 ubiquitin ligase PARAQUAT TOLERANCE 3-like [Solanum pennellii]
MAIYFKYKSSKHCDSIPIVHPFISVWDLKLKIFESKRYGRGKDFDLLITNSQSNEQYVDEKALIAKNTSVLIRRVPGPPLLPIVIPSLTESKQVYEEESHESVRCLDFECDDFGDDVYAIPIILPVQSSNSKHDEDTKIKSSIATPAIEHFSNGYGFGRGEMEWKKPPIGYVCHRCDVPGHYIQHCPTNGDPRYDRVGVLKHNEAGVSSKGVEGLSSASSSSTESSFRDIPRELYCPLCKELMKDAVIASKCCFSSFCDKCIRNHIVCNSSCVCGARNVVVDALLPNLTLRRTVNRMLSESSNSSSEHGVSDPLPRVQDLVKVTTKTSGESVDELQQKKRKKPCDVDVVNMNWGVAAYYPAHTTGKPFRGQCDETGKAGLKRKREMSIDQFPSVVSC